MDMKKAVLAIALSLGVMIAWTTYFAPKQEPAPPSTPPAQERPATAQPGQTPPATPQATAPQTGESAEAPKPTISANRPAKEIEIRNQGAIYRFSELGGKLVSVRLVGVKETSAKDSPLKDLVRVEQPDQAPLSLTTLKGTVPGLEEALFEVQAESDKLDATAEPKSFSFRWVSPNGIEVVKRYQIEPGSYLFNLTVELTNHGQAPLDDNLGLIISARHNPKEGGNYAFKGMGAYVSGSLKEEAPKELKKEPKVFAGQVSWVGYENSYFLQALIPLGNGSKQESSVKGQLAQGQEEAANPLILVRYTSPPFSLPPGEKGTFQFGLYFGPKRIELLKEAGHDLSSSINLGWFDIIAKPFLYFLNYVNDLVGNFGVAIIVLTLLVKIAFWPLTQKSYKSMKSMQALQPQMAKLKEKFRDDKQRFNQEMMALYKSRKVNPMGGCLPMVIQIPVFIALYRLLDYAIELRHAPFFFWIQDLSAPDRLFNFPIDKLPLMEPPYGIPVLTLLMGASMLIQQKMTPTPGDPTQAKIMMLMPIIFTFVFINFPSGLVLYWLTNNVLSIGQQVMVNKRGSKPKGGGREGKNG